MRKLVEQSVNIEKRATSLSMIRKQALYLCLSMTALLLSARFPIAEKQFLVLAVIMGTRWIVVGKTDKIDILIERRG